MAKKIPLTALTFALVVSWGVLPAMACDVGQIKQAEDLIKTAEMKSPETGAFLREAKRLLSEAREEMTRGEAVRRGKPARELAEEIAAQPSL